ncbi:uncharacterized protein V6R79_024554 [Siganus canaliculatus]
MGIDERELAVLAAHGGGDPGVLVLVFLFVCCVSPAFDRVCVFNVISRLIRVSSFGILTPSSHPLQSEGDLSFDGELFVTQEVSSAPLIQTTAVTGATPRSQLLQADPVLNLPGPSGDAGAVADVPPANVAVQPAAPPDVAVCRSFTAVAAKPCAPHVCDLHLIGRYWQLTVVVILVSWCWFSSLCAVNDNKQELEQKQLEDTVKLLKAILHYSSHHPSQTNSPPHREDFSFCPALLRVGPLDPEQ